MHTKLGLSYYSYKEDFRRELNDIKKKKVILKAAINTGRLQSEGCGLPVAHAPCDLVSRSTCLPEWNSKVQHPR